MLSQARVVGFGFALLQFLDVSSAHCQQISDTTFLSKAKKKSIALYEESIRHQSRLFNGSDYVVYLPEKEEHPYFQTDDWVFGTVTYWGETYDNVPLLYDLSNDQLITEHEGGSPIRLVAEEIEHFSISNHKFKRLRPDAMNKINEGFYDELYGGNLKVYAKHTKTYQETIDLQKIIPRYDANTRYYILKNNSYYVVKNKKTILDLFNDQKQPVRDFIRKNRIRFKNNREKAIVQITEFYDTINQ